MKFECDIWYPDSVSTNCNVLRKAIEAGEHEIIERCSCCDTTRYRVSSEKLDEIRSILERATKENGRIDEDSLERSIQDGNFEKFMSSLMR